jgi:hypothetical protein
VRVESAGPSHEPASRRRLWETSEQLTGVSYLAVPYPEDHAGTRQGRALPPR